MNMQGIFTLEMDTTGHLVSYNNNNNNNNNNKTTIVVYTIQPVTNQPSALKDFNYFLTKIIRNSSKNIL
jgi:hypothetical protein